MPKFGIYVHPARTHNGQADCGFLTASGRISIARGLAVRFDSLEEANEEIDRRGFHNETCVRHGIDTAYVIAIY